jgi:2-phospho-L-lactate guanylyltransferase
MKTWVIMPVKPLLRAKSRLASVLSPAEREKLALGMFVHNLSLLRDIDEVAGTLVITRDTKALAIARDYNATTVQESGQPELNPALMRATEFLRTMGADAVMILPTDIPLLCEEDVQAIIQRGQYPATVVLTPDRNKDGTNAMLVNPPGAMVYTYGEDSFGRHKSQAELHGLQVVVYESTRLALDVDTPEDLELYRRLALRYDVPMIDYHTSEVLD